MPDTLGFSDDPNGKLIDLNMARPSAPPPTVPRKDIGLEWDMGYASGLRDAIAIIEGIRPIADRMSSHACLDGISAIFDSMSKP